MYFKEFIKNFRFIKDFNEKSKYIKCISKRVLTMKNERLTNKLLLMQCNRDIMWKIG